MFTPIAIMPKPTLPLIILCFLFAINSPNANARKEYVWLNDQLMSKQAQAKIHSWLAHGVKATKQTFGKLPFSQITFTVSTSDHQNEPVPWGQVNRSDNSIYLRVSPNFSYGAFINDWTLYHEISHLYLPFLTNEDSWLSEGFASYLQQIIMLKAGILSVDKTIESIQSGLARGKRNTTKTQGTLSAVSADMGKYKAYKRVHWSGVSYFMNVDIQLQAQNMSLITVISKYIDCCLVDDDNGENLVKTLDSLSKTHIFTHTFEQYHRRIDFPQTDLSIIRKVVEHYDTH